MINLQNEIKTLNETFKKEGITFKDACCEGRCWFEFTIGEIRFLYELGLVYTNPKDKKSLPNLWMKHGCTNNLVYNYITLSNYTYINNCCYNIYKVNPTINKDYKINFKYMYFVSLDNIIKLVKQTYKQANNFVNNKEYLKMKLA